MRCESSPLPKCQVRRALYVFASLLFLGGSAVLICATRPRGGRLACGTPDASLFWGRRGCHESDM